MENNYQPHSKMQSGTAFAKKIIIFFLFIQFHIPKITFSQDCQVSVTVILENMKGGIYKGQIVKLISNTGEPTIEKISNEKGEIVFTLPCNSVYKMKIANYTKEKEIRTPEFNGSTSTRVITYDPDMVAKEKLFQMNESEKSLVDKTANALPDTTFVNLSKMSKPSKIDHYSSLTFNLEDLDGKPLVDELICFTGLKRKKNIQGSTDKYGKISVFLPKGDKYSVNFKYDTSFIHIETDYLLGSNEITFSCSYIGTKEVERRKKIEEERILAEEKKLKEEEERFAKYCAELKITVEEGRKRELERYVSSSTRTMDTVISAVLNRNKWNDKLIVCDLTGSMSPYAAQLSIWFQLHHQLEKNLQFVFFNDGDDKSDNEKVIGETGGIYYSPATNLKTLQAIIVKVASAGSGGDCPENNMEALIKGTKLAEPFKELVMIVDNNAPVKDIQLLKNFKTPVHIILCGADDFVLLDYLLIAWKTGGSIHTIEEDIVSIAKMSEGQDLKINGKTYRIMGGKFVEIQKT